MPTYQYECEACGFSFEKWQSITEPKLNSCHKCKKKGKVYRLVGSGGSIIFKGSGLYATDYKNKNNKQKEKSCPLGDGAKCDTACPAKTADS
jgi:putative FmdB family regulatory protein